ncbi:MAG: hypothetical protein KZQ99_22840, partial [Candidatus Thiodiazotropha sp. (ex Dulcina madagascariensis)]|nr:hypothetical protein [Candidatus Thiodiazotropha sp. (ex Dulcina madagascariensis)]
MSDIREYFNNASLAQAAYSDLTPGQIQSIGIDHLQDDSGMSLTQARDFADNWRVLDQYDGKVEETYTDEFGQEHTFLNPTG